MRNPACCTALLLALAIPGSAQPRAFVLDTEQRSLSALDLGTGAPGARLQLDGQPEWLLRSENGRHLLVFDRGPGKDKGDRGWQGEAPSSVTIVDPASLTRLARVELGFGLFQRLTVLDEASGRLTVICPGYDSKKPEERTPREIVSVDLASGQVVGRLSVERRIDHVAVTSDSATMLLFSGWEKKPEQPAQLAFVELAGPSVVETLVLPGRPGGPVLSGDESRVYLLDPGDGSNNPQKNVDGSLHVVSMAGRALEASLDAGREPGGLSLDSETGRLFLVTEGPPGQKGDKHGELLMLEGAQLRARVAVAEKPRFVRTRPEEPERIYVLGEKHLTAVDLGAEPRAAWQLELDRAGSGPAEMVIGPQGEHGLVLYGESNRVETLDLARGAAVASADTGRGGKKFFQNAMAALATAGSMMSARSAAQARGGGVYTYSVFSVRPGTTTVRIEPDGTRAWVLNTQTDDVTIIDLTTGAKLEAIAAGGYEMVALEGDVLATVGSGKIHLLDTSTRLEQAALEIDDLQGLFLSPDRRHAVALAEKEVVCLDGSSGAVHERVPGFAKATDIAFWDGSAVVADTAPDPR